MNRVEYTPRTSIAITYSVWKALFLREAVTRISVTRTSALWLLLEPVAHVTFLMFVYVVIRVREVGGIETGIWLMSGMLAFFMFRRTANQIQSAVGSNLALFAYRQVTPADTVLVRAGLEGFLTLLISIILFGGAALAGLDVIPADPLAVVEAFLGMWLVGLGFGLILSVIEELLPDFAKVIGLLMMPLYMISGVILPLASVPQPYRDWLLLNPLAHGIEAVRLGFAPYYYAVPELDIAYMYECALVMIFFGLVLHRRFAVRLMTR